MIVKNSVLFEGKKHFLSCYLYQEFEFMPMIEITKENNQTRFNTYIDPSESLVLQVRKMFC
jgi:hypothetical protein